MKRTLKSQQEYLKATNGLFAVYSFKNGRRDSGYVVLDMITAFSYIARETAKGNQIILTLATSDKEITKYEIANRCRVPYEWARQFAVSPDYEGIWK